MAKSKTDQISLIDPNRFKIAKNNTYVPGGPMNNNPMNAQVGIVPSSLSGINQFPYGDSGMVNPMQLGGSFVAESSGKPQYMVSGTGYQQSPYGGIPTPDPMTSSMMNASYAFNDAASRGLFASAMGIRGMPGIAKDGIGAQDVLTNSMTVPPQGVQSAEALVNQKGTNMRTGKRSGKRGKA